jgi:AcrR family transcriptional regulator
MGRSKYTAEERKVIIAAFVQATREIIDDEGTDAVSIREISNRTGYSSATLYLYFKDIDELLAYVSVGYLRDYCQELAADTEQMSCAKDAYEHTWQLFCKHTFRQPVLFFNLFFGKHSASIDDTVKHYYTVFPNELDQISGSVLSMLMLGDLEKRNLVMLQPYASEVGFDDETTSLVNEITVACYRAVLEGFRDGVFGSDDIQAATDRILLAIRFLMSRDAASISEA